MPDILEMLGRAADECDHAADRLSSLPWDADDTELHKAYQQAVEEAKRTFWQVHDQTEPILDALSGEHRELIARRESIQELCKEIKELDKSQKEAEAKEAVQTILRLLEKKAAPAGQACSTESKSDRCAMWRKLLGWKRYQEPLAKLAKQLRYVATFMSTKFHVKQISISAAAAVNHYGDVVSGGKYTNNVERSTVAAISAGDAPQTKGTIRSRSSGAKSKVTNKKKARPR